MSTASTEPRPPHEATPRPRLKTRPTASAKLWGHLLSSKDASQPSSNHTRSDHLSSAPLSSITPVDKTGTSLRILLHDTQANLENFSDRVNKLAGNIAESNREISTVKALFQRDHEKIIEDIVDVVNRCQSEIQRTVGAPTQASQIDDVRADIAKVDTRVVALESKIDMLQMLNQTQLQALQTVQDQQGKIIAAISPVLPLLQAVPLHIESVKRDVMDSLCDVRSKLAARNPVPNAQKVPTVVLPQSSPVIPSSKPSPEDQNTSGRRKKRKLGDDNHTSGTPNPANYVSVTHRTPLDTLSRAVDTMNGSSAILPSAVDFTTVQSVVSGPAFASPGVPLRFGHRQQTPFRTPHRQPLVDLLQSKSAPRTTHSATLSAAQPTISGQTTVKGNQLHSAGRIARSPINGLHSDTGATHPSSKDPPLVQGTPKNADSLASTTSTLSQASVAQHGPEGTIQRTSDIVTNMPAPEVAKNPRSPVGLRNLRSSTPFAGKPRDDQRSAHPNALPVTPVRPHLQSQYAGRGGPYLLQTANTSDTPFRMIGDKPMSIKDVRALTATPAVRNEKRFIPLDDDDDDLLG